MLGFCGGFLRWGWVKGLVGCAGGGWLCEAGGWASCDVWIGWEGFGEAEKMGRMAGVLSW